MRIIALDLGDVHTGIAVADELGLCATPHTSIKTCNLNAWLDELFKQEPIKTVVIGYPQTLKGTQSSQTKKVLALKDDLAKTYPNINWTLWDERFTSQEAQRLVRKKIKKDKHYEHSVAAALILQTYLESQRQYD
jgi:putative holliday junction resolvase